MNGALVKATPEDQNLLIELQLIDSQVTQAKVKLASLPELEQIAAIHTRLQSTAVELTVVETELADVTIDLRRSEVDVEQVTDRMAKDENRLSSGQGAPKELEQLQHELVTLAKRRAELEDGELEIMLKYDGVKARVDELLNDQVGLKKLELELNVRLENAKTEINKTLAELQSARVGLLPNIDQPLVDLYEKVRASADGVGAALMVGNKCDGCHLAINAVELERIKGLAADEVIRCEECRRILVRI
jgi:predicted  nucleic acid-binding Zn-ribbon protein